MSDNDLWYGSVVTEAGRLDCIRALLTDEERDAISDAALMAVGHPIVPNAATLRNLLGGA